jgi:hypothetical protein
MQIDIVFRLLQGWWLGMVVMAPHQDYSAMW